MSAIADGGVAPASRERPAEQRKPKPKPKARRIRSPFAGGGPTVGGDDATWGPPFVIPGSPTLDSDDISALVHFGGDRIGVMYRGKIAGEVPGGTSAEEIGLLMAGSQGHDEAVPQ